MKNYNIELLKFIGALGVVLIHYTGQQFTSDILIQNELNLIVRFAVPTFFIISGYFFKNSVRSSINSFKIYIALLLVYLFILHPLFEASYVFIWFMFALAIIQLICVKIDNRNKKNISFIITFVIYLVFHYILGLGLKHDGIGMASINDVIMMLPIFISGMLIKEYNLKISSYKALILIILLSLEVINSVTLEASQGDLFQIFIALILVLVFMSVDLTYSKFVQKIITLSFEMYIIHMLVLAITFEIINKILEMSKYDNIVFILMFVIVLIITLLVSQLYKSTKQFFLKGFYKLSI